MTDPLRDLIRLTEEAGPVVSGADLRGLAPEVRQRLLTDGTLRPTSNATAVACDACGHDHVEDVETVLSPRGAPARAYIQCPIVGRVPVSPARLEQWHVDLLALNAHAGLAPSTTALANATAQDQAPPDPIVSIQDIERLFRSLHISNTQGRAWTVAALKRRVDRNRSGIRSRKSGMSEIDDALRTAEIDRSFRFRLRLLRPALEAFAGQSRAKQAMVKELMTKHGFGGR